MTLSDKADRTVRFSNDSKNQRVILDVSGDWTALDSYLKSSGKKVNVFTSEDGVIADDVNPKVATVFDDESGQTFLRIIESYKDEPSGLMDLLRNGTKLHVKLPKGAPWVFGLKGSHAAWNKVEKSDPKQTSAPAAAAEAPATKPTRIFGPNPPFETIREGLKIGANGSHEYVAKIKKGQNIFITLHDKTGKLKGSFDGVDLPLSEEFQTKIPESRDFIISVSNPTSKPMTYSLDVSLD